MHMLKHVVLFKFKPEATEAQRQEMIAALNGLARTVPEVKKLKTVLKAKGAGERVYHLALFSEFADLAALDRYIVHPDHQKVVKLVDACCEARASFDYE
jgi:quinol monooxygenase YgiN